MSLNQFWKLHIRWITSLWVQGFFWYCGYYFLSSHSHHCSSACSFISIDIADSGQVAGCHILCSHGNKRSLAGNPNPSESPGFCSPQSLDATAVHCIVNYLCVSGSGKERKEGRWKCWVKEKGTEEGITEVQRKAGEGAVWDRLEVCVRQTEGQGSRVSAREREMRKRGSREFRGESSSDPSRL